MAIVFDSVVPPDALTTFIREVPIPADQVLNRLLPDRTFDQLEVSFDELTRTNRAAKFRAFDAGIPKSQRDTPVTRKAKMPPISARNSKGELERLRLEQARSGGGSRSAMINAIYDDAESLTREIRTRMELARGDVLVDGKVTINENGLVLEADFGVPGGNLVDLTTGTPWSTVATADIVGDLTTLVNAYTALNGFAPGGFVTSKKIVGYMLQNAGFRTLSASFISGSTAPLITRPAMDQVLSNFLLPPLLWMYDSVADVDGVTTRILPENRLFLVPPNPSDLGFTAWGVTATSLELVNSNAVDFSFADAPGIVGVVERDGPPYHEEVFVDAIGLPILANPKLLMVAKAIA